MSKFHLSFPGIAAISHTRRESFEPWCGAPGPATRQAWLAARQAWICATFGLLALGCDESKTESVSAPSRSEVVTAAQASQPPPTDEHKSGSPSSTGEVTDPSPRVICDQQWSRPGRDFEPTESSRAAAQGFDEPGDFRLGGGLTWVNFWAAWCKPCKEEIPRLVEWDQKLPRLRVVFVSLDDDERQLRRFLADQPDEGVKATYWLKDGAQRSAWLEAAGMDPDPELPAHLLIDAEGKIRCVVQGAVEDSDFARVQELVDG